MAETKETHVQFVGRAQANYEPAAFITINERVYRNLREACCATVPAEAQRVCAALFDSVEMMSARGPERSQYATLPEDPALTAAVRRTAEWAKEAGAIHPVLPSVEEEMDGEIERLKHESKQHRLNIESLAMQLRTLRDNHFWEAAADGKMWRDRVEDMLGDCERFLGTGIQPASVPAEVVTPSISEMLAGAPGAVSAPVEADAVFADIFTASSDSSTDEAPPSSDREIEF